MNLTDDQCTILTLRGQVTDLEGERDRALKKLEEQEAAIRKVVGIHAERLESTTDLLVKAAAMRDAASARVAELEGAIASLRAESARMFEEATGLLGDALRNLPGESTIQQSGTRRDIERWLAKRGAKG